MTARPPLLSAPGIPPAPARPAHSLAAPVTGPGRIMAGFPPGFGPAGGAGVSDVWPLAAAPLALAALPGAAGCAALRARLVAAEWALGSLAVGAGQVAGDPVAAAVAVSRGLGAQPVVRLWLRGDGSRMLIAVWDGRAGPPAGDGAGEWPFAGIAVQRGWHRHEGGRTCWAVLSWRDARLAAAGQSPGKPS